MHDSSPSSERMQAQMPTESLPHCGIDPPQTKLRSHRHSPSLQTNEKRQVSPPAPAQPPQWVWSLSVSTRAAPPSPAVASHQSSVMK